MRALFGAWLLAFGLIATAPWVAAAGPAKDMITQLARAAEPVINDRALGADDRAERLQTILRGALDRKAMAKSLLGRYWRRATPDQRQKLVGLLEGYLIDAYAGRVDSLDGDITFSIDGERDLGERTVVDTQVLRPNGPPVAVSWQVEEVDGKPSVTDILVEGISLIVSQRADFASVIRQRGGIDGLIEQLEERASKRK